MEARSVKVLLRRVFERAEAVFDVGFGRRDNPITNLGALGWFFYWICAASGVYLYIFFDTGIVDAYASVEYMTNEQWYAAGIMRSLHRYTSDALVVVAVIHLLREYSLDRFRGKLFFAWLTGVPLLAFIYICGISGYWLVWDKLAQYIAVSTSEWLDALPVFSEPIANNFFNSTTLGGRFFTLMVFIHIFVPLFMLLLMWVHVQRHAAARVNPTRNLMIGTGLATLLLSIVYPATSQGPADLDVVPVTVGLDWYYLALYPLLEVIPGGWLWVIVAGGALLLMLLPWMPPQAPRPAAIVSLENCNGCGRCVDDCPYSAIRLAPRSDGKSFETEAVVNDGLCVSCGICAGACPTATPFRRAKPIEPGIQLPNHDISELRDEVLQLGQQLTGNQRLMVFACRQTAAVPATDTETAVVSLPCVGMLPPPFIDFVLSRGIADGVMIAGCAEGDCYYRFGGDWTRERLARRRDPYLRRRVPSDRLAESWLPAGSEARAQAAVAEFRRSLPTVDGSEDD